MIKFLILFLLISTNLYAEKYVVEKPDGSVAVINYVTGSQDSLDDVIQENGFSGAIYEEAKTLPPREDRKYWKKSGSFVVVDSVNKQKDLDAKAAKEAEKEAVFSKLKISKEEYEKINGRLAK